MRRASQLSLAIATAALLAYGVAQLERAGSTPHAPATETAPPPTTLGGPPPDALGRIDANIATYGARARAGHSWLDWNFVAINYMDRARLTGDYADWREADLALESAFRDGSGFGPYLTRAALNSAMHRIDRVDADLDAAAGGSIVSQTDRAQILAMRADARYYGGRYDEARALFQEQVERTHRDAESLVLLAQLEWHTGRFPEAVALMDEAQAAADRPDARTRAVLAWVLTTRAMLERDRGRLDDAMAVLSRARSASADDPHQDEVRAEVHEARGELDEALHLFRSVAARTSSPQSLDGAARVLRARGDTIEERELVTTARQSYEAQMALFPEAAYGHAIDHWLRLEPGDVDRMITIAEGNAEARPYGETRVKLAMAYLLAGRIEDARTTLDAVLATEWSTADLHGVNALVLEREGRDGASERAAAEAIAPGAMARLGWLTAS